MALVNGEKKMTIQPRNTSLYRVAEYLASVETRFRNMARQGIDKDGYPNFQQAMKNYERTGRFTVGNLIYLFNRTHDMGYYPKYNHHKGLHKRMGEMLRCPIKDIIDAGVVDWKSGRNGVMTQQLANAIAAETKWHWYNGDLRPKKHTTFDDLFGADDE